MGILALGNLVVERDRRVLREMMSAPPTRWLPNPSRVVSLSRS